MMLSPSKLHASSAPPEVAQHIESPLIQGQGTLVVFFMNIYDGTLWVSKKNEDPKGQSNKDLNWLFSQRFSLTLNYNREITKSAFVDYSIDEMRRYFTFDQKQEQSYRDLFNSIFSDVKKGDRISALFDPITGINFTLNGQSIGKIESQFLAKKYIQIWVHPKAHYQRFRQKILGYF